MGAGGAGGRVVVVGFVFERPVKGHYIAGIQIRGVINKGEYINRVGNK